MEGFELRGFLRTNGVLIVGLVVLLSVGLFDVAWFSFREVPSSLDYRLTITPSAEQEYRITIPTVVDSGGVELPAMDVIVTSRPVNVTHVNATLGLALQVTASGAPNITAQCRGCVGHLSYGGRSAVLRSNAAANFTLGARIDFVGAAGYVETNVFGSSNGGDCTTTLHASGSVSSISNWTTLDGSASTLCGDFFNMGTMKGLSISVPFYIAAGVFLAAGVWIRRRHSRQ